MASVATSTVNTEIAWALGGGMTLSGFGVTLTPSIEADVTSKLTCSSKLLMEVMVRIDVLDRPC